VQEPVELHGVARLREMPRALERDERPTGQLGNGDGALARLAAVELAVDDEHRAANAAAQRAGLLLARKRQRRLLVREDERLGASVKAPLDTVLDVLGRVRLWNLLGEEELEEAAIVPTPVVDVAFRPALVGVERLQGGVAAVVRVRRREAWEAGWIAATPSAVAGWVAASISAQPPPSQMPARSAVSVRVASRMARPSSTNSQYE
jgi:hypothetical protein